MENLIKSQTIGTNVFSIYERLEPTKYPLHPYLLECKTLTPKGKYRKEKVNYRYVFKSVEECENKLNIEATSLNAAIEKKANKKAVISELQKNLKAGEHFKINDIIVNTWGFEQSNVEFYQVVNITDKCIIVRPVQQCMKMDSMYAHGMACEVLPELNTFIGEPFKLKLKFSLWSGVPTISICNPQSYYYFHKWDGRPLYKSWYA